MSEDEAFPFEENSDDDFHDDEDASETDEMDFAASSSADENFDEEDITETVYFDVHSSESHNDDVGIALQNTEKNKTHELDDVRFSVLDSQQVVNEMRETITEVAGIMQLDSTTCRILLTHYKWNKDKLLEMYYDPERNDQDQLFAAAHVVSPFSSGAASTSGHRRPQSVSTTRSSTSNKPSVKVFPQNEFCNICYRNLISSQLHGMKCGHRFCMDCWDTYLSMKVTEEGVGHHISCPDTDCDILVDDEFAVKLLKDDHVKKKYQKLITKSYVEYNPLLSWCPAPDCQFVVKIDHRGMRPVTCSCGFNFCFDCLELWHEPINCRLLALWVKKCNDDSETGNWISANTKDCPKCHATIEKDGGCNHMTCRNVACRFEFCWLCMGPWEPHGSAWYNCNRFDDAMAKKARDDQEKSRAALQRYLHYCNRYMNHMNSRRLENKLYASVKTKMEQVQNMNMSWIETQFLRRAVDVLCQCRRTLMYTYAFAYYLIKNNQVEIFETNQADLEQATELLSEYLERDMQNENLVRLKQIVQDNYVESRRSVLIEHCREGSESNWWKFSA